ncbi:hypothetical protein HELRODRAFT_187585 [Helobdella robusta]|uniref:Phosphatidylinositol glycan anchor biosynthesis class U protein n=1 Tax=Helobdella robusta TaxID=6412 RepID=T1FPA8_HELRO|nr:hypothetical protein HELRODRAFT_187585 [Helobdella robusta]ESN92106.1 hypothetical protein HELRODRAFT_187585 [Helobdella robusta]
MELSVYLILLTGSVLRLLLFDTDIAVWLSDRNELSTPVTSWKRLTEGLTLTRLGISPYDGDVYHEAPLTLAFWDKMDQLFGSSIKYLFIISDFLIGVLLYKIGTLFASQVLNEQNKEAATYHPTAIEIIIKNETVRTNRLYTVAAYMLNPICIASCVARSTGILNNLAIVLSFHSALRRNRLWMCISIAGATYLSLYPIVLLIPLTIYLSRKDEEETKTIKHIKIYSFFQSLIACISFFGILLYFSHQIEGNWKFLHCTFGFILNAPDHSPNYGIFWYFFTELFEHFRLFFVCVFQIHAFLYVLPLSCRLVADPFFAAYLSIAFTCVFKSYPSYGDMALWGSMIFLWSHTFRHLRSSFLSLITLIVATILGPVLWHLWMYAGSANANFYFASSLAISAAQVFIIFDLLFAYQKRKLELKMGVKQKGPDGKPVKYYLE